MKRGKEWECIGKFTIGMFTMRDAARTAMLLFMCALVVAEESDGTAKVPCFVSVSLTIFFSLWVCASRGFALWEPSEILRWAV